MKPKIVIARVVDSYEKLEAAKAGAIYYYRNKHGSPAGMFFRCPHCDKITSVAFDRWRWNSDNNRPTLDPSLIHDSTLNGCGWHGWLRNGAWRAVA